MNRSRLFGGSDMIAEEPFGCYVNDTSAKKPVRESSFAYLLRKWTKEKR